MSEASNQLGLDFNSLQSNISSIAAQFKLYGNTSQEVVRSFYEVAKGLEATGLSAKSSGELAQSYISHFKELTTAQKAYISQMSGGPGGLQGAFDIDNLLRQGKFEDVFKKVKETMKMNLGDLVSLEEAGQSQEAASRYQKQLSMLQSGPLGAFAKSSDEAERFIDAMKKSDEGKFEGLQSAAISLRDSYRAGKDRQTKTTSFQDKVESGMSDLRVQAQVIAYNTSQYLKGQDSKGETLLGEKGRMVAYERALKESGAISSVKTELGAPYNVTNAEGNARQSQRDTIRYLDALTRSTNIFAQSLREQHVKNAASLGIKDAGALSQLEIDKEIKEIEKKKKDKSLDEKAKKQLEAQLE
jgi:hypothetical protein